jgi:hypothetical protein
VLAGLVAMGVVDGSAGVRRLRPVVLARYWLGEVLQEVEDRHAGLTVLSCGLQGSPFFSSLTRRVINAGSAVFPSILPTGFDWVAELAPIPSVDAGDKGPVVAVAKMGGNILTSNEAWTDGTCDLAGSLGDAMRSGMGALVDEGILYGEAGNAAALTGIYAGLTNISGATLREAAITAAADIMGAGGVPNRLFVSPTLWAREMSRETPNGPVNDGAEVIIAGLPTTVVPKLKAADAIVADTTRAYGVVREDSRIEVNRFGDQAWTRDGVEVRVVARVNAAVPAPANTARSLTVTAGTTRGSSKA